MKAHLPYDHEAVDKAYRLWINDRRREGLPIKISIFDDWLEDKFGMIIVPKVLTKERKYIFNNENERLMFLLRYS